MDRWVKKSQRDYPLAFKLELVALIEKGELTPLQAKQRYGVQGSSTVMRWLQQHGRQGWKASSLPPGAMRHMAEPGKQTPEQRILELELQLKEAQQKASFFEAVVTVLKKDYGVAVTKKPAGRSSRKRSSKG